MYEGDLTVLVVPANKVAQACMELSKAHGGRMQTDDAVGCAIVRDAYCAVVIPETPAVIVYNGEVYPVTPEAVLHHELGHCNGWRHR